MSVSDQRNLTPSTSSSSTGQQRRSTFSNDDKVKVNKPDEYHGDQNTLDDWITQVEIYFVFSHVPDEKKPLFASTFL